MEVQSQYLNASKLLWLWCLAVLLCQALAGNASNVSDQQGDKTQSSEIEQKQRVLQRIQGYGADPPASRLPLQLCEGDCDNDDQCDTGLVCFQRSANAAVPGCIGGEGDSSNTDYCIFDSTGPQPTAPVSRPTLRPVLQPTPSTPGTTMIEYLGNNGFPASLFPLPLCGGDCDSDSDCQGDLICYQRDRFQSVPGCLGGERDSSRTDYCIVAPGAPQPTPASPTFSPPTLRPPTLRPPTQSQPTSTKTVQRVGNDGSPSSVFPLGECQGDCDDDGDCDWGLYCFQRGGRDGVPGCLGGESDRESTDYCVSLPPDQRPPPGSFRLKLYWEQGYFWQEETTERKWCATFDYDGFPGSGQCWYGQDSRGCNSDQMYIAKCGNDRRQSFLFTTLSDGEVLIKIGNGENKCWQRERRSIYLRTCDQNNPLQRWIAPNGSFAGSRFEMSQRGFEQQCVSGDHHPKAGEVVELHSCTGLRNSDTSYWNKY